MYMYIPTLAFPLFLLILFICLVWRVSTILCTEVWWYSIKVLYWSI